MVYSNNHFHMTSSSANELQLIIDVIWKNLKINLVVEVLSFHFHFSMKFSFITSLYKIFVAFE